MYHLETKIYMLYRHRGVLCRSMLAYTFNHSKRLTICDGVCQGERLHCGIFIFFPSYSALREYDATSRVPERQVLLLRSLCIK